MNKSSTRAELKSLLLEIKKSGDLENKNKLLALNIDYLFKTHLKISSPNQYLIGAYAPMDLEPNWTLFLKSELGAKLLWSFPLLSKGRKMEFGQSSFSELEERSDFGVKLMLPKRSKKSCMPHLLFVPGLGFTKKGERIGKGKGFYDRYLNEFMGVTVGLCFEEQIIETLPVEEHDKNVQFIVTDKQIINCKKL